VPRPSFFVPLCPGISVNAMQGEVPRIHRIGRSQPKGVNWVQSTTFLRSTCPAEVVCYLRSLHFTVDVII
jgi:hypothetical protein